MEKKLHLSFTCVLLLISINFFAQVTEPQNNISSDTCYVGTSNDYDILFKRGGINAGRISNSSVYFGLNSTALNESISIGVNAGMFSSGKGINTYLGHFAGAGTNNDSLNYGRLNTFVGSYSGEKNKRGFENVFIGAFSANTNNNGRQNTFIGNYSGFSNEDGNGNTYIGYASGIYNTNGTNNIFIGKNSGKSSNGYNSIIIGNNIGNELSLENNLLIDNIYENEVGSNNLPLIWGDFFKDKLKFNVNKNSDSFLEINGFNTSSGLRFTNLNSSSIAQQSNGKVLSVDNNGEVILVDNSISNSTATNVYTIGLSSGSLTAIQMNCNAFVDNSTLFLNDAINNAIANGYKKIYIQEGVYLVNNTIEIIGKFGINIEGSGFGTIIKPTINMASNLPMLNISDGSYYCNVKNISFEPHDVNTGALVHTCIRIGAACDKNTIENLMIGRQIGGTFTKSTKPIYIDLPIGEADFNTFQNIHFKKCLGGIYIKATQGIFNSNLFNNINFDKPSVAIEFEGNGANDNVFSNLKLQISVNNDGLTSSEMTSHFVKNVSGSNNVFRDLFVADWNLNNNSNLAYILNTIAAPAGEPAYNGAYRTTIENVEVEANGNIGQPYTLTNYYQDLGAGTQFINNANGNRNTDYIHNDVNNIVYEGQTNNSYKNNFKVGQIDQVVFSNRGNNELAQIGSRVVDRFEVKNFKNIYLGNYESNYNANGNHSTTKVEGDLQFQTHHNMNLNGTFVLTNANSSGKVQWTNVTSLPSSNIYNNHGWLQGDRTVTMQNGTSNFNLRFNKNNLQSNMASGSSDVLFLNSSKQAVAIGANGLSNSTTYGDVYKLIVNGKTRIKDECLIIGTGWADYVFRPEYKLKPLSEVEKYIRENGHLPNVPSEKTIVEEGLPLAEITKIQQEKIEELTLYLIDLEKKIELQNQKIEFLLNSINK